jgi:hypothetical protein
MVLFPKKIREYVFYLIDKAERMFAWKKYVFINILFLHTSYVMWELSKT